MKIVMVSWLKGKPVPPISYGGIERVCATLSRELIRQGHEVILIAPHRSSIEGAEVLETDDFDQAERFIQAVNPDIVHDHSCWALESPVRRLQNIPFISTTHVRDAIGWSRNVVYLSYAQRDFHEKQIGHSLKDSPIIRVPTDPALQLKGYAKSGDLLFLGMVAPWKGVDLAIQVAEALDKHLIVAGPGWGDYFEKIVVHPRVTYVGEVSDPYRSELLERSYAMMCLHNEGGIGWWEPGAGVIGEAGAMGTPVAAFPNGCLFEITVDGENGWLGNTVDEVVQKMIQTPTLPDPGRLARTEWSAENIVRQYVELYEKVINGFSWA